MSVTTDDISGGRVLFGLADGVSPVTIDGETLERRNDRDFKTRELIHSNDKLGNLNLFAFLITLFIGVKDNDEGLSSDKAISDMADALSIDKLLFETTLNDYKSDNISAYEAARITRDNLNTSQNNNIPPQTSKAVIANAESVITKYAKSGNPLLELIADKESNGDYNRVYGAGIRRENLTEMTIDQVLEWQREYVENGSPSSAAGRYQIIRTTLEGLKDEMGLTGDELYDEEMQDRMAMHLLNRRGYDRYLAGDPQMDEKTFMENIAKEWASMPKDESGVSYYAGDGLNKAHATPTTLLLAMRSAREIGVQDTGLKDQFAKGGVEVKDPQQPDPLIASFDGKGVDQIARTSKDQHIHDRVDNTQSQTQTISPT